MKTEVKTRVSAKKLSMKNIAITVISILVVVISALLPPPAGLTHEGMIVLGLMVGALIMWITEAVNMAITTILVCVMLPFLNILSAAEMYSGFAGKVFFFMIGTFSITAALATTTIPTRMAGMILRWAGKNPKKLVLGFTIGTAILSSIMSNVPTCALFATLGISILKVNGNPKPGTSNLGKCLMMAIPAGSVIGGFMTPAGGPTNLIAISALEAVGIRVTFLDWMIQGYPIGLICCVIFSLCVCLIFKPEGITDDAIEGAKNMVSGNGPMTAREWKALIIVIAMFVLWVASTWVPLFDTTLVALLGMCVLFLPGIEVINWQQYCENSSWDALFLIGGVGAIAAGASATGAASWLINTVLADAANWSPVVVAIAISAVACLMHVLCPSGPAVAGLLCAPMIILAQNTGVSVTGMAMIAAFWGGVTFMLPTDAVPMFTYAYGYYSVKDMLRNGWLPSIIMIVLVAIAIPSAVSLLGYT